MAEFDGTVADFFANRQSVLLMGLQTGDAVLFGGTQQITVLTDSMFFTTPAPTAAPAPAMAFPPILAPRLPLGVVAFVVDTTVYLQVDTWNGLLRTDDELSALQSVCASYLTSQEIQGVVDIVSCTIEE